jgi:hypothetical protein
MSAVRLRNFRSVGDPGIELRLGKRLTMMYGENGAGKSTLCRALKLFSSLPELMADLDENDCHQFNTNLAIELEASFEGRGRPLLDGTWVEVPIARVAFRFTGWFDDKAESDDPVVWRVEFEHVDGTVRRWVSEGESVFWEEGPDGARSPAGTLVLEGDWDPHILASELWSADALTALRACILLGGNGDAWLVNQDTDSNLALRFRAGTNGRHLTLHTIDYHDRVSPNFNSLLPMELDMQLAFQTMLELIWSSILPDADKLYTELLVVDKESALKAAAEDAQERYNENLDSYDGGDIFHVHPTLKDAEPYSELNIFWTQGDGIWRVNDHHSSGEKLIFKMIFSCLSARLYTRTRSKLSPWTGATPFGPVVFEEPELHLHSRTQGRLLRALLRIDAIAPDVYEIHKPEAMEFAASLKGWKWMAQRFPEGLRPLVIETHSEALLQAALDLVERGQLNPDDELSIVSITRIEGTTQVHSMPISPGGLLTRAWPGAYPGAQSGLEEG